MTFNIENPVDQTGTSTGQPEQSVSQDQGDTGAVDGITPEKLAEILKRDEHAQTHITRLEEENALVRQNFATLQEELDAIKAKLTSQKTVEELLARKQTTDNNSQQGEKKMTEQNSFDPSAIDEIVTQRMQDFMAKQEQEANFKKVSSELASVFKDKADDHVKAVAEKNGLSFDDAINLAKTNPSLFGNVFLNPYKSGAQSAAPTQSSQSQNAGDVSGSEINMEYWNKMRRENNAKFFSASVQKEYHKWFHENKK